MKADARVGIFAGDLTGALAAAAPFRDRSMATYMSIGIDATPVVTKAGTLSDEETMLSGFQFLAPVRTHG